MWSDSPRLEPRSIIVIIVTIYTLLEICVNFSQVTDNNARHKAWIAIVIVLIKQQYCEKPRSDHTITTADQAAYLLGMIFDQRFVLYSIRSSLTANTILFVHCRFGNGL